MNETNMRRVSPSAIDISSGLVGSGHIVARAIMCKIVRLNAEKDVWRPFTFTELKEKCPESSPVVLNFLTDLLASGKLTFSVKDSSYEVTEIFIGDCQKSVQDSDVSPERP